MHVMQLAGQIDHGGNDSVLIRANVKSGRVLQYSMLRGELTIYGMLQEICLWILTQNINVTTV